MSKSRMALLLSAMLITAPAYAQTAPGSTTAPGTTAPSASSTQGSAAAVNLPPLDTSAWSQQERTGEWRASKIRGLNVYNGANEKVGEIEELMLKQDGSVDLAIISVGGFLGLGEHYVAVPFKSIVFADAQRRPLMTSSTSGTAGTVATAPVDTTASTNRPAGTAGTTATTGSSTMATASDFPDRALLNATKDQLKAAPQFKYSRS